MTWMNLDNIVLNILLFIYLFGWGESTSVGRGGRGTSGTADWA